MKPQNESLKRPLQILVVDENEDYRILVTRKIHSKISCDIDEAATLELACPKLSVKKFDVVISGISDLQKNVHFFIQAILSQRNGFKFVLLTWDMSNVPNKFRDHFIVMDKTNLEQIGTATYNFRELL